MVATYSVASPRPGVRDIEMSQTRTLPSRCSQVWGGDRHVIKKAGKGEHLQARVSAGLSYEKLQDKGYGMNARGGKIIVKQAKGKVIFLRQYITGEKKIKDSVMKTDFLKLEKADIKLGSYGLPPGVGDLHKVFHVYITFLNIFKNKSLIFIKGSYGPGHP